MKNKENVFSDLNRNINVDEQSLCPEIVFSPVRLRILVCTLIDVLIFLC